MRYMENALPSVGDLLQDGDDKALFTVSEIFPAGQYAGMILEWEGYNPSKNSVGLCAQAFTTKDWQKRWRIMGRV